MAVTAFATGTGNGGSALTVGTEHFVSDVNVAGVFQFHVDLSTIQDGDILEMRVYEKVLTGDTSRVVAFGAQYGAANVDDIIAHSKAIPNDHTNATALRFSLKQTFGTGRSPTWKVIQVS